MLHPNMVTFNGINMYVDEIVSCQVVWKNWVIDKECPNDHYHYLRAMQEIAVHQVRCMYDVYNNPEKYTSNFLGVSYFSDNKFRESELEYVSRCARYPLFLSEDELAALLKYNISQLSDQTCRNNHPFKLSKDVLKYNKEDFNKHVKKVMREFLVQFDALERAEFFEPRLIIKATKGDVHKEYRVDGSYKYLCDLKSEIDKKLYANKKDKTHG